MFFRGLCPGAPQKRVSRNLRKGVASRSFPFLPPFHFPSSPLEVGPLKPAREPGERCKLPEDLKRIWCTLKLSKSHWNILSTVFYSRMTNIR